MSKQLLLSFISLSVATDVPTQTRTATVALGSDEKSNVGGVITPTYTLMVVTDETTAKEIQRIGNLRVEVEDLPVYGALKDDIKLDPAGKPNGENTQLNVSTTENGVMTSGAPSDKFMTEAPGTDTGRISSTEEATSNTPKPDAPVASSSPAASAPADTSSSDSSSSSAE
jgi:hypothetical protein